MFPNEDPGGLADGGQVERTWDMPGPAHFQGMEEGGVDDAVKVGFALGGEAGVEFCFFPLNGENANPGRKVEIQGPQKHGRGVGGGKGHGSGLTEGMDPAIGPPGARYREGFSEDFFQGGFEGQLDGGVGILPLPTKEILTAVGEGEFKRL
jgi:hypothetical protein